jgi:hypothetical protein
MGEGVFYRMSLGKTFLEESRDAIVKQFEVGVGNQRNGRRQFKIPKRRC